MKRTRLLTPAALFLSIQLSNAGDVYSQNIIGYVNEVFSPGYTLFANPFSTGTGDNLSVLFANDPIQNGTTVSLWNPATQTFDTTSRYSNNHWSLDFALSPGLGAELFTPSTFTNTFVGNALAHDGTPLTTDTPPPPPVYSGPDGILLLSDKAPISNTGTDIFLNILGRMPNPGEQVTLLASTSPSFTTSTYLGNGQWDTPTPTLNVGQSAFLNVQSVPEPSTIALACFGGVGMFIAQRRKKS